MRQLNLLSMVGFFFAVLHVQSSFVFRQKCEACQRYGPMRDDLRKAIERLRNIAPRIKASLAQEGDAINAVLAKLHDFEAAFDDVMKTLGESIPDQLEEELSKYDSVTDKFNEQTKAISDIDQAIRSLESCETGYCNSSKVLDDITAATKTYFADIQGFLAKTENLIQVTGRKLSTIKSVSAHIHNSVNGIKSVQQEELRNIRKLKKEVDLLSEDTERFLFDISGNKTLMAESLKNSTNRLNNVLIEKYNQISKKLDQVLGSQYQLELVLLFGKAANRIEYLEGMRKQPQIALNKTTGFYEPADAARQWARAVIYGEPSDQCISDLLEDISVLIQGDNSATGAMVLSVPQNSILHIYGDSIKELVELQSSRQSAQSERYYMELFQYEVLQLELLGFAFQLQARRILQAEKEWQDHAEHDEDVEEDDDEQDEELRPSRVRREAGVKEARDVFRSQGSVAFENREAVMQIAVAEMSTICPSQRHWQKNEGENLDVVLRARGNIFLQLHVNSALASSGDKSNRRIIGCRFETNFDSVTTQCLFRSFNSTHAIDSVCDEPEDIKFPSTSLDIQNARKTLASGVTERVTMAVTDRVRVQDMKNETICGLHVSIATTQVDGESKRVVVLAADVCNVRTGELLRPGKPETVLSPTAKVTRFTHINKLWTCPSPVGSIGGVAFRVTELDHKRILELSVDSVFMKPT